MGVEKLTALTFVSNETEASKRSSQRVSFYQGDFPSVIIKLNDKELRGDVYDLSSDGLGILPQNEIRGLDAIGQEVQIKIGHTDWQKAVLASINHVKFSGSFRLKLGFSLTRESTQEAEIEYLDCQGGFPQGFAKDPISFNKTIIFNIISFSANGFTALVRDKDISIFYGVHLDVHIMFPTRGEKNGNVEITNFQSTSDGFFLECKWLNVPFDVKNAISEYLLMTDDSLTITKLRQSGFMVTDLENALIFRIARTEEEFSRILDLRLRAAQGDGRWIGESDTSVMKDESDKYARQIYCELNGKVVAASRIVFNNGIRNRSEHFKYDVPIPEWIWQQGFVEGSRVCTDPQMRGSDIFMLMIQNMSDIVTKTGYRYMVMNCVQSLVPVYKKTIGVKSLGLKFNTKFMQNDALHLLLVDVRKIQIGINFMPFTWVVTAEVGDHLLKRGILKLGFLERALRMLFKIGHIILRRQYVIAKVKKGQRTKIKS